MLTFKSPLKYHITACDVWPSFSVLPKGMTLLDFLVFNIWFWELGYDLWLIHKSSLASYCSNQIFYTLLWRHYLSCNHDRVLLLSKLFFYLWQANSGPNSNGCQVTISNLCMILKFLLCILENPFTMIGNGCGYRKVV